jgi:hypothetical protein
MYLPDLLNDPVTTIVRVKDDSGREWRVLDIADGPPRRAVPPGADPSAPYRYFMREDLSEMRCFAFSDNMQRRISEDALRAQLGQSKPGAWR